MATSRIMKDFYISEENASKRPRVFGMTASPVDSREDVVKAAKCAMHDPPSQSKLTKVYLTESWKLSSNAKLLLPRT